MVDEHVTDSYTLLLAITTQYDFDNYAIFFLCKTSIKGLMGKIKQKTLTVKLNYVSKGRGEGFEMENSIVVLSIKVITKNTLRNTAMCYYCL